MTEQITDVLFITSLVFFNLFCIIGIVATVFIISVVGSTRKKILETLESIKHTSDNVGEIAGNVVETVAPLLFRRRKKSNTSGILSLISRFF